MSRRIRMVRALFPWTMLGSFRTPLWQHMQQRPGRRSSPLRWKIQRASSLGVVSSCPFRIDGLALRQIRHLFVPRPGWNRWGFQRIPHAYKYLHC